ncbi:hypothetical protein OAC43_02110, partial [Flavobacteriaceae bacterium]|nr:hypothetical protein [Flavobacteriaceae bacterium]
MANFIKIRKVFLSIIAVSSFFGYTQTVENTNKEQTISAFETDKTEQKIADIISKMTLKEKAGQMINIGLPAVLKGGYWDKRDTAVFNTAKFKKFIIDNAVGSIHNTPRFPATPMEWNKIIKTLQ